MGSGSRGVGRRRTRVWRCSLQGAREGVRRRGQSDERQSAQQHRFVHAGFFLSRSTTKKRLDQFVCMDSQFRISKLGIVRIELQASRMSQGRRSTAAGRMQRRPAGKRTLGWARWFVRRRLPPRRPPQHVRVIYPAPSIPDVPTRGGPSPPSQDPMCLLFSARRFGWETFPK
jgi:hypothetical protein